MKFIHRATPALSFLLILWIIVSFASVMLNVGNVELWVTTLSVSLASSIVLMPIFVIVHYATGQTLQDADRRRRHEQGPVLDEQPPFVDEDEQEEAMPVSDSASPNQK